MNKVSFTGRLATNPIQVSDYNYSKCTDFILKHYSIEIQVLCRTETCDKAMEFKKGDTVTVYGKIACDSHNGYKGDMYIIADKLEGV
jgi:hypothetical protein